MPLGETQRASILVSPSSGFVQVESVHSLRALVGGGFCGLRSAPFHPRLGAPQRWLSHRCTYCCMSVTGGLHFSRFCPIHPSIPVQVPPEGGSRTVVRNAVCPSPGAPLGGVSRAKVAAVPQICATSSGPLVLDPFLYLIHVHPEGAVHLFRIMGLFRFLEACSVFQGLLLYFRGPFYVGLLFRGGPPPAGGGGCGRWRA